MDVINGAPWAPSPSQYTPHFILPSTTSAPKHTEEKGITTQDEKTPANEDQQPIEEEVLQSQGRHQHIRQQH